MIPDRVFPFRQPRTVSLRLHIFHYMHCRKIAMSRAERYTLHAQTFIRETPPNIRFDPEVQTSEHNFGQGRRFNLINTQALEFFMIGLKCTF